MSAGDVRGGHRPLLARLLRALPCRKVLPIRNIIGGTTILRQRHRNNGSRRSRSSVSRGTVRGGKHGRPRVRRTMPTRILLSGGVNERAGGRVRIGESLLSFGLVCSDGGCSRVVCDWGRRGIDEEWAGGVLGGDGRRWSNASVGNVDRRAVSGQHRGLERDRDSLDDRG